MNKAGVLIVEDERIIAFDLQEQLQRLGYSVLDVVSNGKDAVQRAAQLRPAIVLMDIFIEGDIDGIDAARQVYGRFRIPVVFLTAFSGDNLVQRATTALPFGYLTKPFDLRELHATMQVALARSVAQSALELTEARLRLALQAADLLVWERRVADEALTIDGDQGVPSAASFHNRSIPGRPCWIAYIRTIERRWRNVHRAHSAMVRNSRWCCAPRVSRPGISNCSPRPS